MIKSTRDAVSPSLPCLFLLQQQSLRVSLYMTSSRLDNGEHITVMCVTMGGCLEGTMASIVEQACVRTHKVT
jgi:hypothetical protein